MRKPNIEIISLIYHSVEFLDHIAAELTGPYCRVPGWDVGIRIVANDAKDEVLTHLLSIGVPYSIFTNPDPTEYYINRTYRCYNYAGMSSEYDNICFVNSDMIFSRDWLSNLLKHHDGVNIPVPHLVESRCSTLPYVIERYFGRQVRAFDKEGFYRFADEIRTDAVLPGGSFMPCVFKKQSFIDRGMFPERSVPFNEIPPERTYLGRLHGSGVIPGDAYFFANLELDWKMRHITVFDSIVYHVSQGEGSGSSPFDASFYLAEK